jgi:hypothetical protein
MVSSTRSYYMHFEMFREMQHNSYKMSTTIFLDWYANVEAALSKRKT